VTNSYEGYYHGKGWVSFLNDNGTISTTVSYTINQADGCILVDATAGNLQITLPSIYTRRSKVSIKKIDFSANFITIFPQGSAMIDGSPTHQIYLPNWTVTLVSDGNDWFVI